MRLSLLLCVCIWMVIMISHGRLNNTSTSISRFLQDDNPPEPVICGTGEYAYFGQCRSCSIRTYACSYCTPESCSSCIYGYILLGGGTTCFACPSIPGCEDCWSETHCSKCQPYTLNGEQCFPCAFFGAACESCSTSTCTACESGNYIAEDGRCVACTPSCKSCNSQTCLTCEDGYYLKEGTCHPCIENCKLCSDSVSCMTCFNKFFVNKESSCSPCHSRCNTCENNQTCTSCESVFHKLDSGYCCGTFCTGCNATGCVGCPEGYYMNGTLCLGQILMHSSPIFLLLISISFGLLAF